MRRLERVGLAAAAAATATGIILIGACSKQVSGTAEVNQTDLAAYVADVTSSSVAASSSKAAAVKKSAKAACDTFRTENKNSIDIFNAYIDASDANAPDQEAKADAAVTSLRNTASQVGLKVTGDVPSSLATSLRKYRDDANALADTLARRAEIDPLNAAIDTFNATKDSTFDACDEF